MGYVLDYIFSSYMCFGLAQMANHFENCTLKKPCSVLCVPPSLAVAPGYNLADFLIESAPLKKQLEQEASHYEYEVSPPASPTLSPPSLPTKHQLISCLAARGHWVTTQPHLQLDPPHTQQLMMKGASLHFLFEAVWGLSGAQQGHYLHTLKSVVSKLQDNSIK